VEFGRLANCFFPSSLSRCQAKGLFNLRLTRESELASNNQEIIRVVIYDQEYNLRGQLDPEYIRKLARYVDEKMRSVAARTQTVDSLRTAILAAMNIADEYHQMAARYETGTRQMDSEFGKYSSMLDEVLDPEV